MVIRPASNRERLCGILLHGTIGLIYPSPAALHGPAPVRQQALPVPGVHGGGEGGVAPPQAGELLPALPHAGGQAGQIGLIRIGIVCAAG